MNIETGQAERDVKYADMCLGCAFLKDMELIKQTLVEMEVTCAGIASLMLCVHNP